MLKRTKPLKKALPSSELQTSFSAEVHDLASDGRGVVRHPSGQVYFVAGVWPGESGEFKVTEKKGRFGVAQLMQLHKASVHRISPPCPHFGPEQSACGACPWQFVAYPAQLKAKYDRVKNAANRIGVADKIMPIIGSEQTWGYRNRAQFKTDGERLGYLAARSNKLIDVTQCPVLTNKNQSTLQALRSSLPDSAWRPSRKRVWNSIDIDEDTGAGDIKINQRLSFKQANSGQNLQMKAWLSKKVASVVEDSATVLELFSGSGNFTRVLVSAGFKKVVAVEVSELAITQLKAKSLPGVEALTVDLFSAEDFSKLIEKVRDASVLVLDPPRDGLKIRDPLLKKKTALRDIFYISCDLATFFRDISDFQTAGFKLLEIQPLDLFPQTPHVELMAVLKRKK